MPKTKPTPTSTADPKIKTFLDMIAPSVIKFNVDHFICGNTFRCVYALREYPTATNEQVKLKNIIQAEKLRYYIAYGSNLNINQMSFRCPSAKVIGTSEIKDYELVFRGSKTGSYAIIEPCDGQAVPILVWSTSKRDELALDIYEGYPNFYEKEEMVIEVNGIKITAYVYIMPDTHALAVPSQMDLIRQELSLFFIQHHSEVI